MASSEVASGSVLVTVHDLSGAIVLGPESFPASARCLDIMLRVDPPKESCSVKLLHGGDCILQYGDMLADIVGEDGCVQLCVVFAYDDEGDEAEEIGELTEAEKEADPYYGKRILRTIGSEQYQGNIEEVEVGKNSGARLYRVTYDDGDLEHLTIFQIRDQCSIVDSVDAVFDRPVPMTSLATGFLFGHSAEYDSRRVTVEMALQAAAARCQSPEDDDHVVSDSEA